jgi:uncharacterized membrane protein
MRLQTLISFSLILFGIAVVGLALAYADHVYGGPGRRAFRRDDVAAIAGVGMVVLGIAVAVIGRFRRSRGHANDGETPTEAH